jgi:hypothetical protein
MVRLVGELKTVKVEAKRREIVSELDVLTFAALGHLRGMDG